MNFTEAIRKSNLAKEEVLKTREDILKAKEDISKTKEIAEGIKTALIEQGVEIENIKFEDISQFIKENNISSKNSWKRPKEWLELPKVVVEEDKYTNKVYPNGVPPIEPADPESLDDNNKVVVQDNLISFEDYLLDMTNLSEVATGMKDGVFNVSANDFAYEMLCKIEENNDNLLLFEGIVVIPNARIPFTDISRSEISSFLTDLYIQIDDEKPLNLTELAKGEIDLPTEGKYKDIAILNRESLRGAVPQSLSSVTTQEYDFPGIVTGNLRYALQDGCYPLSLLISLDYNCFSDKVKMRNGDKQCIVKIWGNGFIHLTPYRSYISTTSVINIANDIPSIVKANDCILDVTICDSDIELPFLLVSNLNLDNKPYLPISLECLLLGFGEFTQKITMISSMKPDIFKNFIFNPITYPPFTSYINRNELPPIVGCTLYSTNDFNFHMNLKEIDCSNTKYYNDYSNMLSFLLSTNNNPLSYIYGVINKIKSVENIIFPDFKIDISNNDCRCLTDIDNSINATNAVDAFIVVPYCFNLNAFKSLRRNTIIDLINKLPIIDLKINEENLKNIKGAYPPSVDVQFGNLNNKTVFTQDTEVDQTTVWDSLDAVMQFSSGIQCFNGNQELVKKYLMKYSLIDDNINNSLIVRLNLDSTGNEPSIIDTKWFHSILVSPLTFKELTEDDIKLASNKGWRIVTGLNYPMSTSSYIIKNFNSEEK